MAKYINADEYVIIPVVEKMDDEPSQLPITIGDLIKRITKKEPIFADVREVVHGHWMPHPTESDCAVCSVCGTGCIREVGNIIYGYAYCPNCGADMQGNDEWFVRKFTENVKALHK